MLPGVLLCALLAPTAPGPVYLGVAPRSPDLDVLAERTAIALGQTLEKRGATDLGSPPLPDVDELTDSVLVSAVTTAKQKYLEGDFAGALDKAGDGVARFESNGAFRANPSWRAYGEALVLKALALRRLGKESEADVALTALIVTQPDQAPDPDVTPPKVAKRHDELRAELRAKARSSIEITSDPPGADVVVDGKPLGKAPVVARDLLPGTHFVGVSADGQNREKKITVAAGSIARVDEKVGDPRIAVARAVRDAIASPVALDALAKKAKPAGDDVLVGALVADKKGPLLVLARVRGDRVVVAGTRVEMKGALKNRVDALADALLADKEGWLVPAPGTPSELVVAGKLGSSTVAVNGNVGALNGTEGEGEGEIAEGEGERPEDDGSGTFLAVGIGAVVVTVLAGAGVAAFLLITQPPNRVEVVLDASSL